MALQGAIKMMTLRELWHRLRPPREDITIKVREAAAELRDTAKQVSDRLAIYEQAHDPFVAMLADIYERRQEANIWRGTDGESRS